MNRKMKAQGNVLSGIIISVLCSVGAEAVLLLIFAYLLFQNVIGMDFVEVSAAVIKTAGALLCGIICAIKVKEKRVLFCPLSTILYTLICFLLFSAFSGEFHIGASLFKDFLINGLCGLGAAFIVNLGYKRS